MRPFGSRFTIKPFVATSIVVMTAVLASTLALTSAATRRSIVEATQSANVTLTRSFVNEVWPNLRPVFLVLRDLPSAALSARQEIDDIDAAVRRFGHGTDVLKIKIYDMNGHTIYSSDKRQIGEDKSSNGGFRLARTGMPNSELNYRGEFGAFDGEVYDRNLVSSYLPVLDGGGAVEAVAEIYTDRTPAIANADESLRLLAMLLVPLFYATNGILVLLVWHADRARQRQNDRLEYLVTERTSELLQTRDATIYAFAVLAETRDSDTGNHIRRTQRYVRALAQELRNDHHFANTLTDESVELLFKSAPLHDIGKVGIPDNILLKPGKLTSEEFAVMKCHPTIGRDAILAAESVLGAENGFLRFAREIAYSHQEKWDGSGYPEGLSGAAIPLSARLMAVADVYDALISRRVYKPPFSHATAVQIITQGSGAHFDPDIVAAFSRIADEFNAIACKYSDGSLDLSAAGASEKSGEL